jgi:hypothetical protein
MKDVPELSPEQRATYYYHRANGARLQAQRAADSGARRTHFCIAERFKRLAATADLHKDLDDTIAL